jgi:AAA domain
MSERTSFEPDPDRPDTWINELSGDEQQNNGQDHAAAPDADLLTALAVQSWCDLPLPPMRRLLGDVVTEAARVFLVGATGIGKTLFAYAIAAALAAGKPFLHWSCDGPVRVLVIDGEMSARMIKKRAQLIMRHQSQVPPGNLLIYSLQRADEFAQRFPQLGKPAPLNTPEGQEWLLKFIALVQPDVVILDNVMSLIAGVMKEEEPWQQTLPLVLGITALGKAQIWLDHTGWNSDRQYGTSTKGWFFDAIGVLLRPPQEVAVSDRETCFDLSFDPPSGKARNRDPDRWIDFAPHRIRLNDNGWSSEPIDRQARGRGKGNANGKVQPGIQLFHDALMDALAVASTRPGETTATAWEGECLRRGLMEPFIAADDHKDRSAKRATFRKAKSALLAAKMVAINGEHVRDLTRQW